MLQTHVVQNFRQDIHACASEEGTATHIVHDRAEVFDARTEAMFRYLQVTQLCSAPELCEYLCATHSHILSSNFDIRLFLREQQQQHVN